MLKTNWVSLSAATLAIVALSACSPSEDTDQETGLEAPVISEPVSEEPTETEPLAEPERTPGEAAFDAFMARQERDPRFAPLLELCGSPPVGGLSYIADVEYERPGTYTAEGGINFLLASESGGEVLYDSFTIPLETLVVEDPDEPALAISSTADNVTGGGGGYQSNGERWPHHSYENEMIETQMPWCSAPGSAVEFLNDLIPTLEGD